MIVKALSRLSDLASRRLPHALRRTHQAVARPPPSQLAPVSGLTNDDYFYTLYEDLMILDCPTRTSQPSAIQQSQHSQKDSELLDIASISSKNTGLEVSSETIDTLLADYAKRGNTRDFELCMSRVLSAPPTEHQRDLHVKVHIVNSSLSTQSSSPSTMQRFPTSALAVLHQYEASGHFAPIKSYTRVISALFNVQTWPSSDPKLGRTAAQAQAWDLFAHMRYVAHPIPDAHLYSLMIRACGSFSPPEPQRALDMWMEMQENGIKPTKGAYEALIKVCGRAGPEWVGEAVRLAREMCDQFPVTSVNGRGLWCALLEGCKRAGDLQKARWILAEAVRGGGDGSSSENSVVDAEMMMHMFHTYASYQPPFRRETTRLFNPSTVSKGEVSTNQRQTEEISSHSDPPSRMSTEQTQDVPVENMESMPSFSRLPPQTSFGVIAEVRALFNRILQDGSWSMREARHPSEGGMLAGHFTRVELTPVLLNAYLSVFYRHASIETSREAFDSLFSDPSSARLFHPDEYTYINALERCAIARTEDRHIAAQWAEGVWQSWEATETKGTREGKENVGLFARLIERAHAAMRRVLILSGDVDGALALLRTFVSRYPPKAVLQPADSQLLSSDTSSVVMPIEFPSRPMMVRLFAQPPIFSTRTVLTNPASSASSTARPLVRLTSVITPKDDRVPPVIGFTDVDLLHARLAEHGRSKDLGYIKWVCMAYANALKKRRAAVLHSRSDARQG